MSAEEITWARVDRDFYVASAPGRFLGCIDRQGEGNFVALDTFTRPIGSFPELAPAMTAVIDAAISGANA